MPQTYQNTISSQKVRHFQFRFNQIIILMQIVLKNFAKNLHYSARQLKLGMCLLRRMVNCNAYGQSKPHRNLNKRLNIDGLFYRGSYGLVSVAVPFKKDRLVVPIDQFINAYNLEYQDTANGYKLKYCPFCAKPHNNDPTNYYTLNVKKQSGCFHCFRCAKKGSWLQFRESIMGLTSQMFEHLEKSGQASTDSNGSVNDPKMSEAQYFYYKSNIQKEEYKDVMDYLHSRGFKDEVIKQYNIGAGYEQFVDGDGVKKKIKCIYFPAYKILEAKDQKQQMYDEFKRTQENGTSNFHYNNIWSQIAKVKIRGSGKQNKRYMRQMPQGGQKGFFGLNLVKDTDNTIVLTQGQFDAMAVYQQTGIPALSLPQGATNLSEALLPYLKRFSKIILWMDNDDAGLLNTSKMLDKLGINRTHVVKHNVPKMKDANDFLLNHPKMIAELIGKAKTIPDSSLLSFNELRESIFNKISKTQENFGVKVSWLPFFNKVVKGIRMGQLTIMSGPTGSGKTTFLTQISLDLCKKDISVLWGSFQIRNETLITSMLYQFSNLRLDKHLNKFQHFADKFERLPLHFMNFYGSHNIQKILSTIIYSIEKYNVHVVMIDTLQFLLSEQAEGFKKFQLQDTLMAKLRDISIKYNVHVVIVIHPRKTEDNDDIGIHSIYGTSKATQEADNIWLIQNRDGFKIFDVKKNRYDGQLGRIPLGFNRNTKNFFQLTAEEFTDLRTKEKSMADICTARQAQKQGQSDAERQYNAIFDAEINDVEMNRAKKNTFKPQGSYSPPS